MVANGEFQPRNAATHKKEGTFHELFWKKKVNFN